MASVKVAVRVRPFNQRELDLEAKLIIEMKDKRTRIVNTKMPDGKEGDLGRERHKDFTFDYSYWSFNKSDPHYTSQEQVFGDLGTDVIDCAFEGYNACVFAYGQTGSGKTFTMMGSNECLGLIPRICQTLFQRMQEGAVRDGTKYTYRTEVSYLEIYNERVRDLLSPVTSHSLRVREHPRLGPYVQDLSKHLVTDYSDIEELMVRGNNVRTTASTNMNDVSSRSHAIFTLMFTQAGLSGDMPTEKVSKVHLVDLAGSERADATGATGKRLVEGAHINKSLVTLGSVISALADASSPASDGSAGSGSSSGPLRRTSFIPYRDSVLTWLLKDSLGGNSKTIMIADSEIAKPGNTTMFPLIRPLRTHFRCAAISPANCNYGETLSTLRYANRAKNIVNKPTVNEDPNVRLIRELREEIARLRALRDSDFVGLGGQGNGVLAQLHQTEAREKALTEEWAEKWRETQQILTEQRALGLRKSGMGVILDSDRPHLVGIDDDLLSTGVRLYHLKEGRTLIGSEESESRDIVLSGVGIETDHCVIELQEGVATLVPMGHAQCWVNTVLIDKPTRLSQGCIILLGRTNMFRYNDPVEAAKLRKEGPRSQLNLSRMSLLSWSTSDLAVLAENMNISSDDHDKSMHLSGRQSSFLRDDKREKELKRKALEEAQEELELEKQRMDQNYQQQCQKLVEDWQRLEQQQIEGALLLRQREAEIQRLKEALEWERQEESARVAQEKKEIAQLKESLEEKQRELQQLRSNLDKASPTPMPTPDTSDLSSPTSLTSPSPLDTSEAESWTSMSPDDELLEQMRELSKEHEKRIEELRSEFELKMTSLSDRHHRVDRLEAELVELGERQKEIQQMNPQQLDTNEITLLKQALTQRSREELEDILNRKQSFTLDLAHSLNRITGATVLPRQPLTPSLETPTVYSPARENLSTDVSFHTAPPSPYLPAETSNAGVLSTSREDPHGTSNHVLHAPRALFKRTDVTVRVPIEGESPSPLPEPVVDTPTKLEGCEEEADVTEACATPVRPLQGRGADGDATSDVGVMSDSGVELDAKSIATDPLLHCWERPPGNLARAPPRSDDSDEVSSTEDFVRNTPASSSNMPILNALQFPLAEGANGGRQRSHRLSRHHSKYSLSRRVSEPDIAVRDAMRALKNLCERVANQKLLVMRSLEDDCGKQELNCHIAVLQELQRQYLLLEHALETQSYRQQSGKENRSSLGNLASMGAVEDSDDMSTSADDGCVQDAVPCSSNEREERCPSVHSIASTIPAHSTTGNNVYLARSMSSLHSYDDGEVIHIPSYVVRGAGSQTHYEYEVRVSVNGECWSLLRRYRRFRDLHLSMRGKYGSPVAALDFPPRRLFKRSEAVASKRRTQLEAYLRALIRLCSTMPQCPLYQSKDNLTRSAILEFSSFFRRGVFESGKYGTS